MHKKTVSLKQRKIRKTIGISGLVFVLFGLCLLISILEAGFTFVAFIAAIVILVISIAVAFVLVFLAHLICGE